MTHRYVLFIAAAAGLLLQAASSRAQSQPNAYAELQQIDKGGPAAYQNAADGSEVREGTDAAPVQAQGAPASSAPAASSKVYGHDRLADAEPPAPIVHERIDREYEHTSQETDRHGGGSGISLLGAGLGAAAGYGAAVLVSATLYCLPLWGILAFVAGGALVGGFLLKKFF